MPISGRIVPAAPTTVGAATPADARAAGPTRTFNESGLVKATGTAPARAPEAPRSSFGPSRQPISPSPVAYKHDGHRLEATPAAEGSPGTAGAPADAVDQWHREADENERSRARAEARAAREQVRAREAQLNKADGADQGARAAIPIVPVQPEGRAPRPGSLRRPVRDARRGGRPG